jgi:hypothetical protein
MDEHEEYKTAWKQGTSWTEHHITSLITSQQGQYAVLLKIQETAVCMSQPDNCILSMYKTVLISYAVYKHGCIIIRIHCILII